MCDLHECARKDGRYATLLSARIICGLLFSNPQSVMLFRAGHTRSARSQQLFVIHTSEPKGRNFINLRVGMISQRRIALQTCVVFLKIDKQLLSERSPHRNTGPNSHSTPQSDAEYRRQKTPSLKDTRQPQYKRARGDRMIHFKLTSTSGAT